MSESERMPGKRNRSHVPPIAPRASRIAKLLSGQLALQPTAGAHTGDTGADDQNVNVFASHEGHPRRRERRG